MGIFENFEREGKGISKDAPPKTGIRLFIDIISREFWTFIWLNLLFIFCSIPIVTIGASYSALNSVIIKMIKDKPVDLIYDFKKAFKKNIAQGTIAFFITAIVSSLLFFAYNFYFITSPAMSYLIIGLSFLLLMINNYVFPLIVCVKLKLSHIYKNSLNLAFVCLKYSVTSALLNVLLFIICFILFPSSVLYILLFGFSFACFLNSFFVYKNIKTYVEEKN